jgi:hypothetical protein
MPLITIALDGESGIESIDYQIDSLVGNLDLGTDCELAPQ